jgi:hypothetical protein
MRHQNWNPLVSPPHVKVARASHQKPGSWVTCPKWMGKSRKPSPSTSSCEAKSSSPPRLPPPLLYCDLLNCCVHHGVNIQRSYTLIVSKGFTLIAKVKCTYHQHEGKNLWIHSCKMCIYSLNLKCILDAF